MSDPQTKPTNAEKLWRRRRNWGLPDPNPPEVGKPVFVVPTPYAGFAFAGIFLGEWKNGGITFYCVQIQETTLCPSSVKIICAPWTVFQIHKDVPLIDCIKMVEEIQI